MTSFSVIIPTIGRDSLRKILGQLEPQLGLEDEVIVVSDGPPRPIKTAWSEDLRVKFHIGPKTNIWGNEQRNLGIRVAKGTHLLFLDDDDEVLPDYLEIAREAAEEVPGRVLIFKMKHQAIQLWDAPKIQEGFVSTQMLLVPNVPGRLGYWTNRYEADFDFLTSTLALYPPSEKEIWMDEVLTIHGEAVDKGRFVKWPSLSLVIPTIGRPLLKRLLDQVIPQLWEDDEVLVVGDGPQPEARAMTTGIDPRVIYHEFGPSRLWGHPQRNWAMLIAEKSHLMFLDDDDETIPGAFNIVREVAARHTDKLLIFKTMHQGSPIWVDPEIRKLNVSTQCFVVPNIPERFGTWGHRYAGDLDFITSCVQAHPLGREGVLWRPEITSIHGEPQVLQPPAT